MIPEELEEKIKEAKNEGRIPFFVNITCGTTVLGSFDPINKIADICEKYKVWLHADVSTVPCDLMLLKTPSYAVNSHHLDTKSR